MRFHSLAVVVFGAVVAGTLLSSVARADDASDAKDLFTRARDLRGHGDCASALPLFQRAYELYPSGLGSLRNVAVCQEALGRFTSARDAWLALKRALMATNDPKYSGWNEDADHAVARLVPRVSKLTADLSVVAPGGSPVSSDGVDVTVDGEPLAPDRIGVEVERDPGTYVVRASGIRVSAPDEQTVQLAPGEAKRVSLRVTLMSAPASAPVVEKPPPGPLPAPTPVLIAFNVPERRSPLRTGAWIAFGVGAASLAAAAVSLGVRQTALSDLEQRCPRYETAPCAPSQRSAIQSDVSRGRTVSTLLDVFGAAAIVGSAMGVVLLAKSHPRRPSAAVVLSLGSVSAEGGF